MIDQRLINFMTEELGNTPTSFRRYIFDKILWEDRFIGLVGPRGVGKSTLIKQYILSQSDLNNWLYVSADHSYFAENTLTSLADEIVRENRKGLVIDEIHKLYDWSRQLKQIYDSHSNLKVIFTGSSILDIRKGMADLSRRVLMYEMQGLSFREYLAFQENIILPELSLDEIVASSWTAPTDLHPLPYFRKYLETGYFPFCKLPGYDIRLQQTIFQTIDVDIPSFAGIKISTARKLLKMLSIISRTAPLKPSMQNLASELKISKNDVPEYLLYLEQAGMLSQVRDDTGGMRGLGKVEKVFLDNTNLIYTLGKPSPNIGTVRETFFYNQMRVNNDVMTAKRGDFRIEDYVFEIGGHKKGNSQITGIKKGLIVKDDIEYGQPGVIPLWHFGLNY